MTRLIDADALKRHYAWWEDDKQKLFDSIVDGQPTVDAVPVRHGKWVVWDEVIAGLYHTVSECSECGFTTDKMFREEMPHCPNCGARMDEERDSDHAEEEIL